MCNYQTGYNLISENFLKLWVVKKIVLNDISITLPTSDLFELFDWLENKKVDVQKYIGLS